MTCCAIDKSPRSTDNIFFLSAKMIIFRKKTKDILGTDSSVARNWSERESDRGSVQNFLSVS